MYWKIKLWALKNLVMVVLTMAPWMTGGGS